MLCRVNLELEGYDVLEADTLEGARAALGAGGVDAVLLDIHVGLDHGAELLEEILARTPRPPVAVVSGSTDVQTEDYSRADAVLAKPFTIEALTGVVRQLLSG